MAVPATLMNGIDVLVATARHASSRDRICPGAALGIAILAGRLREVPS
jgi:hypothetical protein